MDELFENKKTPILGIHYFPDTVHYREKDLQIWAPKMANIGISSVILLSPLERAIPETFIRGLIEAGVEPVVHLKAALPNNIDLDTFHLLISNYARWGVKHVIVFDRPNDRTSWNSTKWLQKDLIERFVEEFLSVGKLLLRYDLLPILPPLEPGGSYWDTAFLRSTLEGLLKRDEGDLLNKLMISSYAYHWNRSLNWGAGGPIRWAGTKPYFTPEKEQDQKGFRIFEWYDAICNSVLSKSLPQIILGACCPMNPGGLQEEKDTEKLSEQSNIAFNLYRLAKGEEVFDEKYKEQLINLPQYITAINFYLLASSPGNKDSWLCWYDEEGNEREIIQKIQNYQPVLKSQSKGTNELEQQSEDGNFLKDSDTYPHPINHYLLLPKYSWGISDWHLDVIKPFVKRHSVTVGFSVDEAMYAQKVTVIGNDQVFSDQYLSKLRQRGCEVERIDGDGTTIASILSMR